MQHQIHHERKFYQDKKTGYWISTNYPRIRAHVWVWKNRWGNIPTGYHVHHCNGNRSDNRIENLELVHRSRHLRDHMTPERREWSRQLAEKIRPLTKIWHASEEGLEWHRQHGLKTWEERKPFGNTCKQCNKQYQTKLYHQEFCSGACKSKWRRDNKCDDIDKECPICKKNYRSSKYSRSKTCGRACGKLLKSTVNH